MNLRNLCSTALSVAAAAALSLPALAQNNSPNYPGQPQQTYPNQQQQTYPNQQPNYPSGAQQPSYPSGAQQQPSYPGHDRDRDMAEGQHNWTTDQLLTATVHQAWILSGRNEQNFFEIVRQLAEISARNRNLVLPNDPASGHKAGEFIKEQARADHDQLLYDIVDKAVRMTGTPASQSAADNQPAH